MDRRLLGPPLGYPRGTAIPVTTTPTGPGPGRDPVEKGSRRDPRLPEMCPRPGGTTRYVSFTLLLGSGLLFPCLTSFPCFTPVLFEVGTDGSSRRVIPVRVHPHPSHDLNRWSTQDSPNVTPVGVTSKSPTGTHPIKVTGRL